MHFNFDTLSRIFQTEKAITTKATSTITKTFYSICRSQRDREAIESFHNNSTDRYSNREENSSQSSLGAAPKTPTSSDSSGEFSETTSDDIQDTIQYYNGNLLLPIYSMENKILSPVEVMNVLFNIVSSVSSELVCSQQPLHVEHNRTFIIDLDSLKCKDDVKCDDIGSWKNQSYNKFLFTKQKNDWVLVDKKIVSEVSENKIVPMKRHYFTLQGDENNEDFKRRIDTVVSKFSL